ncbi:MAG: glycoside hydrolase family 2 TIM barrel-domain containing protein [Thermoguttaceae bacterium]
MTAIAPDASAQEGRRADSVALSGPWEFAVGQGDAAAFGADGAARLAWQPVTLPGNFLPYSQDAATATRFIWARRSFQVTGSQAARLGVLRWDHVVHGATVFINGRQAGYHEPTGPYQVILPEKTLVPGKNEIVLKIAGAAGVRKSASGNFLFPAGQIWGPSRPAMPAVDQDIWIDFADRAYMKWILAIPTPSQRKVVFRVTPSGPAALEGLTLSATVRPWPDGASAGSGEIGAMLTPDADPLGGEHFFVEVPLTDVKAWTPEEPNLYTAQVRLSQGDRVLDEAQVRFGMRELAVADGNFQLNGKDLWIRGSNLVHEWAWGDFPQDMAKEYLVTEARELSTGAFRTHTQPPPQLWADLCDEGGTMILAEFPLLYNYRDPHFTAEEWEIFHRNAMIDTAGWMARLWNHPSVVLWVLSNESRCDNEWESGVFDDFVTALDPTRSTMRTGTTGTRTNYDVHTCGNTNHWTHEGQMQLEIDSWFRAAQGRTTTNSEYMNIFDRPKCQWTGSDDDMADRLAYAQIGMEQTEAMRRARVDAILPYMYAGWSRTRRGGQAWKAGYAWPVSACWHSSLSPILASLDLFDADYVAGREVTTDLCLINDTWRDVQVHVDMVLTDRSPEFLPEAECFAQPLAKWSFDFQLAADSVQKTPVTWKLPDRAGNYWLTARTTGIPGRPVLSQRFVRAVEEPQFPPANELRRLVLLGADETAEGWVRERGVTVSERLEDLSPREGLVLVWNPEKLSDDEKGTAPALRRFAAEGGRIVVLSCRRWDWPDLCSVEIDRMGGSRVFAYEHTTHWLLRDIDLECLKRWNGLPGTVAAASLTGRNVEQGKRILWVREPKHTVAAEVATADGKGTVLFSQLEVRGRVLRSSPSYDPVAERILVHAISK